MKIGFRVSITYLLVLNSSMNYAQTSGENLVPNPSFEQIISCPTTGGWISLATPWDNIVDIGGGADLYNVCSPPWIITVDTFPRMGVPENNRGYQYAHSGDGYAGFYAVSDPETYPNFHEFVQTPLTEPIHAGVQYEVVFYVSLTENYQYAVGTLGAHFSVNALQEDSYDILPDVEPQVESPVGVIYDSKDNWMEVRDTFVSRIGGGEQWLTVGNFLPDTLSEITFVDSGAGYGYDRSYYYIDDVSVVALDTLSGVEDAVVHGFKMSIYPNPTTDILAIECKERLSKVWLTGLQGRRLSALKLSGQRWEADIEGLPDGIYLVEAISEDGRRTTRKVVKQ